jgi:hypothetical protein
MTKDHTVALSKVVDIFAVIEKVVMTGCIEII